MLDVLFALAIIFFFAVGILYLYAFGRI